MLPQLRRVFQQLHQRRDRAKRDDDSLGRSLEKTGGDLGGATVSRLLADVVSMNAEMQAIQDRGVVIKDFNRGLVDFPSIQNGREVFLCWELEEDDIEFWHDIDAGYAGRERL